MTPLNLQDQWARLLISSLKAAGVEHVNVTPGSRSTPWTWAALQQPGLCCHLHIDERSAAFFALGQAKATGAPSLLICTSGSAVANYFPAVIEANASRTPLLVLSADRPFELQGVDAPQTIDQTKLFGSHCRRYLDLGVPSARHSALRALARTAVQAVHATQYPEPGPVQLNARASKPLEPQSAEGELASSLEREVETLVLAGPTRASTPTAQADVAAIRRCAESAVAAARGLILCGPEPMASQKHAGPLWEFASATGFLVLCEAASQRRFAVPQGFPDAQVCDGFPTLFGLDEFPKFGEPDFVLQLGAVPVTSEWESWLAARPKLPRFVVALHGWPDPESSATELIQGDSREVLQALAAHLGARRCSDDLRAARREFAELFGAANSAVWRVTEQALRTTGDALSEASAVRLAVDAAPSGSVLGLGNSLPIRDVDLYCRFSRKGLRVFAQRGANGIDGLVSGAAGVATALSEPTTLIVGDVSLLHDVGGLWAARQVKSPLVILVIDNAGGRIFEQLPVRSWLEAHHGLSDYWLTPHGLELSRAAELYGVRHQTARTASELSTALRTAHETPATTLIVAKVPPHSALEHRRRVLQLVATEIRSLLQSHPPSFV